MSKTTGLVLSGRRYVSPYGSASPATYADTSRFAHPVSMGTTTWYQLPSGIWTLTNFGRVHYASGVSLDNLRPFTAMAWVMTTGVAVFFDKIFDKGNGADVITSGWQIDLGNGTMFVRLHVATTGTHAQVISSSQIPANIPTHVAVSWNGSLTVTNNMLIYLNAVNNGYLSTQDGTGAIDDDSANILCFGNNAGISRGWHGWLTQPVIYNRVLSLTRIRHIFETERGWFNV